MCSSFLFFFFKQKTAYDMRISDWSSDVCSSDLAVEITAEERRTALRAAKIMGLNVAGVDLLRSASGPMVMEVNSSPGLEGIENASGIDIADQIIRLVESNAKPNHTRTKGTEIGRAHV